MQLKPGFLIVGTVTQSYDSHISLLIFDFFNAVVYKEDINDKIMVWNAVDNNWIEN